MYDDDEKRVRTYGASAEKLCVADNISTKKNKKTCDHSGDLKKERGAGGGKVPSVIQQAVTHLIYLPVDHRGPVSYLAVVPTRPAAPKVRSTLT